MRVHTNAGVIRYIIMSYEKNRNTGAVFRALTGVDVRDFDLLLPYFRDAHDKYFRYHQLGGKPRKGIRPPVIYKTSPLPSVEDRLYFILYYLKNNPTQQLMADHFDMEKGNCNVWIHTLYGILTEALSEMGVTPASSSKDLALLYRRLNDEDLSVLIHDGTEREIPRPQDNDHQRDTYSGKKKRHTLKNGIVTTFMGAILFVSPTVSGKTHDKRIADDFYFFPEKSYVIQDTGYLGYKGDWDTFMPFKKPRGGQLDEYHKKFNRTVSSHRVRIEHYIGSAKILRTVKDECRLRKNRVPETVMHVAAAIHNLRLGVKLPLKAKIYLT